ncbi:MAG: hypothetical protein VR72_13300 [Clostridiaceae bacterium BRH_c20a]|nr:MAG: hypothetical protein VR72_13300 [Clostridiaceae bacterium BRH_c20a]
MKKINLNEIQYKVAQNRKIAELASAQVLDSQGVTCRLVEVNPISSTEPRNPHIHLDIEETIYVLEGEGEVWFNGNLEKIYPNDLVLIPKQEKHMILNTTNTPLKILCFFPSNDMEATQVLCTDITYPNKEEK